MPLYYERSGIPRDTVLRVRIALRRGLHRLLDRALPEDFIGLLYDEMDCADLLWIVEREFDIRFPKTVWPTVDGTLDNLIRLTHGRIVIDRAQRAADNTIQEPKPEV
jgi:hypothetical protein